MKFYKFDRSKLEQYSGDGGFWVFVFVIVMIYTFAQIPFYTNIIIYTDTHKLFYTCFDCSGARQLLLCYVIYIQFRLISIYL